MSATRSRKYVAILASAGLAFASTGTAVAAQPASAPAIDPWLALSAMSSSSAASASATALQSDVGYAARDNRHLRAPPLPVLAVILATLAVAIYILLDDTAPRSPD